MHYNFIRKFILNKDKVGSMQSLGEYVDDNGDK